MVGEGADSQEEGEALREVAQVIDRPREEARDDVALVVIART
jgi:hypothetical protein